MSHDVHADANRRPNHLASETSPYLLQHVYNPVDWYPWGDEALEKARREDKPIFLSIGYSACHWCHVMAHESFENEEIAALLNRHFVPIKVDREERPDLDDIYMSAVQLLSGQGGWPMSVWLTPDRKPFFGGTYFPPDDRYGRPGFSQVLERIAEVFSTRRVEIESSAEQVAERIDSFSRTSGGPAFLSVALLDRASDSLRQTHDPVHGGFGAAPKFPHSMGIQILLRQYSRRDDIGLLRMATTTLDKMARGGIYDHLGGGFHRYSTDERWLVPHFEKMLYDQALLTVAYLEAWQVTEAPLYRQVVVETLDYVLREMTSPEGSFFSTLDADSEGQEGKFYVWTKAEIESVLGEKVAPLFCRAYAVEAEGNFEGQSILERVGDAESLAAFTGRPAAEIEAELAEGRARLLERRSGRIRPGRDEKIVAAWNGLMISSFARAGRVLGEKRYTEAAVQASDFVISRMQKDGRLLRVYKDGRARFPAYLEDSAAMVAALVDLYEATFESRWLAEAERLADLLVTDFSDEENGGFFSTSDLHPDLIVRVKNAQDGSTPSGNSLATYALLRLGRIRGRADLEKQAETALRAYAGLLDQIPAAFHQMVLALDLFLGPRQEIVVAGPREAESTERLLQPARRKFLPRAVLLWTGGGKWSKDGSDGSRDRERTGDSPLFEGKVAVNGEAAAYLCHDFACEAPVTDAGVWEQALEAERLSSGGRLLGS